MEPLSTLTLDQLELSTYCVGLNHRLDVRTTLTLDQLELFTANPRRAFLRQTFKDLPKSIQTDGLLQNLAVAKPIGRKKNFTTIRDLSRLQYFWRPESKEMKNSRKKQQS